ncbi:hypothetical protein MASR1M59_12470 [Melaminivora sp.]
MSQRLRRELLLTLLLQGGGGLALLLATLWIGHALGPAQQGRFNQLKTLIDLGAVLGTLGMPQALYVYVQSGQMGLGRALRLGRWLAATGLLGGLAAAWWQSRWSLDGAGAGWAWLAACMLAAALASLHAQWRTLQLLGQATWRFNLVTAAPQVLLLALAAAMVLQQGLAPAPLAWGFAACWLLAALYAGWSLRALQPAAPMATPTAPTAPAASTTPQATGLRGLLLHGLATWATGVLLTLQMVLLQRLGWLSDGAPGLGRISLALLLAQLPLVPLNYALPLLLRQRLRLGLLLGGPSRHAGTLARQGLLAALPVLLLALLAWQAGAARSDLWLGPGYQGLHGIVAALLLASAAEAWLRLLGLHTQASQQPWLASGAELLRASALLAWLAWSASTGNGSAGSMPLTSLALGWAALTWAAALLLWLLCSRRAPHPPTCQTDPQTDPQAAP